MYNLESYDGHISEDGLTEFDLIQGITPYANFELRLQDFYEDGVVKYGSTDDDTSLDIIPHSTYFNVGYGTGYFGNKRIKISENLSFDINRPYTQGGSAGNLYIPFTPSGTEDTEIVVKGVETIDSSYSSTHIISKQVNYPKVKNGYQITKSNYLSSLSFSSLVGFWRFDEGSGLVAYDSSGHSLNGNLVGLASWSSGKYNYSVQFGNLNTSFVRVPYNTNLDISDKISICAWVKITSSYINNWYVVLGKGASVNFRSCPYHFLVNPYTNTVGNGLAFWYKGVDGVEHRYRINELPQTTFPLDTWVHVAVTFTYGTGSSIKIYVNGVLKAGSWGSGNGNLLPASNTYDLTIGQAFEGGSSPFGFWGGNIDEVSIFNGILNTTELAYVINNDYTFTSGSDNSGSKVFTLGTVPKNNTTWISLSNFIGVIRNYALGFSVNGDRGYILGGIDGVTVLKDLYEYDPETDTWTAKTSCPQDSVYSCAFTINGKVYICLGDSGISPTNRPFYEYDPETDTWTAKTSCPDVWTNVSILSYTRVFGFSALGKVYVMGATNIWKYDPDFDTWTSIAVTPQIGPYVGLNNKGYGICSDNINSPTGKFMYEFDPITETYTQKTDPTSELALIGVGYALNYAELLLAVLGMGGRMYIGPMTSLPPSTAFLLYDTVENKAEAVFLNGGGTNFSTNNAAFSIKKGNYNGSIYYHKVLGVLRLDHVKFPSNRFMKRKC